MTQAHPPARGRDLPICDSQLSAGAAGLKNVVAHDRELLNTGSELLIGQSLNTRGVHRQRLTGCGLRIAGKPPSPTSEIDCAVRGLCCAPIVIVTGGLGPLGRSCAATSRRNCSASNWCQKYVGYDLLPPGADSSAEDRGLRNQGS